MGRISPCIGWAVIISCTHPFSLQQTQDKWASLAPLHKLRAERVLQTRLGIASPDEKVRQLCDTILCNQIPYYWKNASHFGDSLVLCGIYATKSRHSFSFRWGKVKILKLQKCGRLTRPGRLWQKHLLYSIWSSAFFKITEAKPCFSGFSVTLSTAFVYVSNFKICSQVQGECLFILPSLSCTSCFCLIFRLTFQSKALLH